MEERKLAIVINSYGNSGMIHSFNCDEAQFFDYGHHDLGTMFTFEFRDPHWAVNREELQNKFRGEIQDHLISFCDYRNADIRIGEEYLPTNLENGTLVSFSVSLVDDNRPYAKDIQPV